MSQSIAPIPQKVVGPIHIVTPDWEDRAVMVPLATFESPIWATVKRGAHLSQQCGGIYTAILSEGMTRSILLEAMGLKEAIEVKTFIDAHPEKLQSYTALTSQHARYLDHAIEIVGKLIYLRIRFDTDQASGHNMATKAADAIGLGLSETFPKLKYLSVSANVCADKKCSAVNSILGRGKHVIAEITLSKADCQKWLRSTPEKIHNLHVKKNLMGSILAGSLRSANAHFANMILAMYLSTGQDGANVVEASQGITHIDITDEGDLYVSVSIPNLIIGSIGNGKSIPFVHDNLDVLKCLDDAGELLPNSSQKLASIIAATVLCGEISLLAAQTNPGELTRSHMVLERKERT